VIKSVWTNVWFPAICVNTVILAVCKDFQCKILLVCEDYFLYCSQWEAPVHSLTSSLVIVWHWHSLLMFAFSWLHEGGASSTCTLLRDTPIIRAVWRWVLWLPGLSSCDWQSCSTWHRFSSVIAVTCLPLPFVRSVLPVWRYFARTRLMLR